MKTTILIALSTMVLNLMADNLANINALAATEESVADQALQTLLVTATSADIPALAQQTQNPKIADKAVFLLSAMQSPEADKALHNALEKSDDRVKAGILNALAARGYAAATPDAVTRAKAAQPVKDAALNYLAKTATAEGCDSLLKALSDADSAAAADSCLAAAEHNPAKALSIYTTLYNGKLPPHIKLAALTGLARSDTDNPSKWLNTALQSPHADWRGAAANQAAELPDNALKDFLKHSPDDENSRVALITALTRNARSDSLEYIYGVAQDSRALKSRICAVSALGSLSRSRADYDKLLGFLRSPEAEIAHAAKQSLTAINNDEVNQALAACYSRAKSDAPEKKTLLELLATRKVKGAAAMIADTLRQSADPELRTAALLALREQAEPQQLAGVFAALNSAGTPEEKEAARKALFTLSKTFPEESADAIASVYHSASPEDRILLLQATGIAGSDKGLTLLGTALKDPRDAVRDNALRTLAAWKSPAALEPLSVQCGQYPDEKLRILAQRGYITLCDTIDEPYRKLTALNRIGTLPLREQEQKLLAQALAPVADAKKMPDFKIQKIGNFRSEACGVADFNGDGKLDIVATPYIYYAPEWKAVKFRELGGKVDENGKGYFDNFCDLILDVNKDGKPDVLCGCWFAKQNQWYENPGAGEALWSEHLIEQLGNHETGTLADIDGDGQALEFLPQTHITCWYERGTLADGKPGMIKHVVSEQRNVLGAGAGDINGDGRPDILRPDVWFEAPEDIRKGEWKAHPIELAKINGKVEHTSNIIVFDVNKDGLNDIITSNAHKHGIFWYEQVRLDDKISWKQHVIDESWSQAHYLAFADIDNDGNKEIITGKRFMAHNGGDPDGYGKLCIRCYSFIPGPQPVFSKHTITEDDGISAGLNIETVDMDGDGDLDLVTTGKFGGPVLLVNQLK